MRRSRLKKYKEKSQKRKTVKLAGILIFLGIFVFLVVLYFFWRVNSLPKFIYVSDYETESRIVVIDTPNDNLVTIKIPNDTEVIAARGLGTYKIGSLWELGKKEGYNGKLVAETLQKNFLVPLYLWKDGKESNLNFYQQIKIFLLEKRIALTNQNEIDLEEAGIVRAQTLADGSKGYVVKSVFKDSLLVFFVDDLINSLSPKVEVEDLTGTQSTSKNVAAIMELMGAKVISYTRDTKNETLDCEVSGKSEEVVFKISKIFDCRIDFTMETNLDLKLRIGGKFSDRF